MVNTAVKEQIKKEEELRLSVIRQDRQSAEQRKHSMKKQAAEKTLTEKVLTREDMLNNQSTVEEILAHSSYANKVKTQKSLKKFQGKIKKKRDRGKSLNNIEQKLADHWNASSSWIN